MLVSTRKIVTTPYVITEFHALAERRAKLNEPGLRELIQDYVEFLSKIEEKFVPKDEILEFKEGWGLCFTDSSLFLSARNLELPIISNDRKLIGFCKKRGVQAFHIYYDIYLPL
ncbi:MAG: PIN domain-containing protein [Candidatus Methanospirareceae archaeon]